MRSIALHRVRVRFHPGKLLQRLFGLLTAPNFLEILDHPNVLEHP